MNATETIDKILLIGIGNYSRADDALGWKFLDELPLPEDEYEIEYRYQLQVEDAELISRYKHVIFIDAYHGELTHGFKYYACQPYPAENFTSHALSPENVLWICHQLFNTTPACFVMAISGVNWELGGGLSTMAFQNLEAALRSFKKYLTNLSVKPDKFV